MVSFELGEKVVLIDTGEGYSSGGSYLWKEKVLEYITRYKPCNATIKPISGNIYIESGWCTSEDLVNRKDLTWKVRCVLRENDICYCGVYIISSNENHMIIIGGKGITKI